jgi:hypothetical protein
MNKTEMENLEEPIQAERPSEENLVQKRSKGNACEAGANSGSNKGVGG